MWCDVVQAVWCDSVEMIGIMQCRVAQRGMMRSHVVAVAPRVQYSDTWLCFPLT